jgi:DNA-binding NarL/FixJ family response regulator
MKGEALLVAKHVVFRQALALILEWHADLKAVQVGSLAEAHQVLRTPDAEQPDLAVVDLELPDGEGFELIGEIRGGWPQVSILALTTSGEPDRHARATEAGAGAVLTMAASSEAFLKEVRRLENS